MGSRQSTADFVLEQIADSGAVRARKMFGEYGIYCNEKFVALICDDQLFVKQTLAGKKLLGKFAEGAPYPGAKPHFLVAGEHLEEREWLVRLIQLTAAELPLPMKKSNARNKAG